LSGSCSSGFPWNGGCGEAFVVDGSHFRREGKVGWGAVSVVTFSNGEFVMEGILGCPIHELDIAFFGSGLIDNIVTEAVSILGAVSFLLIKPPCFATVHFDCAPAGDASSGAAAAPDNIAGIIQVIRTSVKLFNLR
jgi:hypothetical protein